jgi:cytochrome c oxidase subunit 2
VASLRRAALRAAVLVGATLSLSSCTLVPFQGADSKARLVHSLYIKIAILALIVFVAVIGALVFEIIAFRRRAGDDTPAIQDHGKPVVYAGFFLIGLVLVAILFPTSEATLNKVQDLAKNPDLVVTATGSEWQWAATYDRQNFTVTGQTYKKPLVWELPVDKTVEVFVKSTDVMHALYLPQFNYGINAIPGITNKFSFTPDRLGTYPGQCTQLCGAGHYQMKFVLKVVTATQFAAWVQQQQHAAQAENCPPPSTHISLVAHNIAWNFQCIGVPAARPFTVTMNNEDAGVMHNFSIYDGPDTKTNLFKGPLFAGPATRVLHVPALPAGTYYFQCDIHGKAMSGTIVAGAQPSQAPSAAGTNIKLTATDIHWSTSQIVVPAGKPVTITFDNADPGITHNFSIYDGPDTKTDLFKGPLLEGPASTVLHVPALPAGTYYFQCDIHGKAMSGTYVVKG